MSINNNTSFGIEALKKNIESNNTGIGAYSLTNNTTGFCNTSLGSNSLFFNVSGPHNTALGSGSMCNNVIGASNTAIGSSALEGTTSETTVGDQNVAIGAQSLYVNNGNQNSALGTYSLLNNKDGSNNVALGFFAGSNNISGSKNTFIGSHSGQQIGDTNTYEYATAIGADSVINSSNNIVLGRPLGEDSVEIPGELNVKKILLSSTYPPYPSEPNAVMPKEYIDTLSSGLNPIGTSKCIANDALNPVNLLAAPPAEIDGYTLQDGDKVLINDQSNSVNNGIWIANIIAGNWTRPPPGELMSVGYDAKGAYTFLTNGTTYGNTAWVELDSPAIVGTDSLSFDIYFQFSYKIGRGLETVTIGSDQVLQVKDNLNFLENITVTQNTTGNNGTFNNLKLGAGATSYGNNSLDISGNTIMVSDITNTSTSQIGYDLGVISSTANTIPGVVNTSIGVLSNGYQLGLVASRGPTFSSAGAKNFFGLFQDALNNGNYNPIVRASDHVLVSGRYGFNPGAVDASGGIVICPWSSTSSGARMDPSGNFTFHNQLNVSGTSNLNGNTTLSANSNLTQSGTGIISQSGTGTNTLKSTNISGTLDLSDIFYLRDSMRWIDVGGSGLQTNSFKTDNDLIFEGLNNNSRFVLRNRDNIGTLINTFISGASTTNIRSTNIDLSGNTTLNGNLTTSNTININSPGQLTTEKITSANDLNIEAPGNSAIIDITTGINGEINITTDTVVINAEISQETGALVQSGSGTNGFIASNFNGNINMLGNTINNVGFNSTTTNTYADMKYDIIGKNIYYKEPVFGQFISVQRQTISNTTTPTLFYYTTTTNATNCSINATPSQVRVLVQGLYRINVRLYVRGTETNDFTFWFVKNGTAIPNSGSEITLTSGYSLPFAEIIENMNANDYIEVAGVATASGQQIFVSTSGSIPTIPAITLNIQRIG